LNSLIRRTRYAARVMLKGAPEPRWDVPGISQEEVNEARSFFPMAKFFIFGHARSGTTLLARLLRLHPEVHCNWQAHFFTRPPLITAMVAPPEVAEWFIRRNNRWNEGRDLTPVVLRAAADMILERQAARAGKRIVGDKSPNSLMDGESVRLLQRIYPDAHVFAIRRDTVLSHLFQAFIDDAEILGLGEERRRRDFLRRPEAYYARQKSLFTGRDLRQRAAAWVKNVEETREYGQALLGARYRQVRYEDLLLDPLAVLQPLWMALGASSTQADIRQAIEAEIQVNPDSGRQMKALPPLGLSKRKGGPGIWEEFFTAGDRRLFDAQAGELLIRLGYEKSHAWTGQA
jgi:LPS sulfotransferase NodH